MVVAIFCFIVFAVLCFVTWIVEERPSIQYLMTGFVIVVLSFWAGWVLTK